MILITSPHTSFTAVALEVAREKNLNIHIVESILEKSIDKVRDAVAKHGPFDVILSRGGTADTLKKHFDIPIVSADITDFDVLQSLWAAKQVSKHIGYLGFHDDPKLYDFPSISKILDMDIRLYSYENTDELHDQVLKAKADGSNVILVGSQMAEKIAEGIGLTVIHLKTSKRALVEAILHAEEIIFALKRERYYSDTLSTVMDLSSEGMVSVDAAKVIRFANLAAENILNTKKEALIHTDITETVFRDFFADQTSSEPHLGKIISVGDQEIIANYLPFSIAPSNKGVVLNFTTVKDIQKTEQRIRKELFTQRMTAKYTFPDIIGRNPLFLETVKMAKDFGLSDHTVIIYGETGTGKERFAHSMHNIGRRKEYPFVVVNCGALPENLLESELFGYSEGAFTGAKKGGKVGLLELAHGGTVFLDEIDKMPMSLQVKILRVLQEKQVQPLGGSRVIPVDIRIISATNRNLHDLTQRNEFLIDLYFRLNVLNIHVPALRERKDDINLLVNHFCQKHSPSVSSSIFSDGMREEFLRYSWPGNVRELENLTLRYITLKISKVSETSIHRYFPELSGSLATPAEENVSVKSQDIYLTQGTLKNMQQQMALQLLQRFGGNKTRLASFLGISRNTLAAILRNAPLK